MSRGIQAQDFKYSAGQTMVKELKYTGCTSDIMDLASKIDGYISMGWLIWGWTPTPTLDFTIEVIQLYCPTLDQDVITQGWQLYKVSIYVFWNISDGIYRCTWCQGNSIDADLSTVHATTTIRDFIRLAGKEWVCLNLLDLSNTHLDVLIFLQWASLDLHV